MSASTQWLSSARARLGVVAWNTLWYATGGAAWTSVEYNATSVFTLLGTPLQNSFSATRTKTGWVAGAGAEWMATTNILLRAEYLYYRFEGGTSGDISLLPVQSSGQPRVTWSGDSVQVGRVAVSYLF
jgi:outer membrane immunogenic protein